MDENSFRKDRRGPRPEWASLPFHAGRHHTVLRAAQGRPLTVAKHEVFLRAAAAIFSPHRSEVLNRNLTLAGGPYAITEEPMSSATAGSSYRTKDARLPCGW